MAEKTRKSPLEVVAPPAFFDAAPARNLGQPGRSLWNRITRAYAIDDEGGRELLLLACEAIDRAESLRRQIERDGEVIRTRTGMKDHPALKHELANRAFAAKMLRALGLDVEPKQGIGRPGGGRLGVTLETIRGRYAETPEE